MSVRDAVVVLRDAGVVAGLSLVAAVAANAMRGEPFPWVAKEAYELFVPCPEPLGEAVPLVPDDPLVSAERTLRVDAREAAAFDAWHLRGAWSIPFDWIEAVPEASVRKVAGSGASAVVVYGDGGDPDCGRELARELSGRGVRNVHYVQGGAPALRGQPRDAGEVSP